MTLNRFSAARSLALAVSVALFAALPAWAEVTLQDINKLMKQGQNAQALEQVDKYLADKPKDAQGRFLKGLILTEMNKPNEAIAVFQKLTEDYPELPEPYNNLAVIYAQQRQYEKAKQALEMAIRTHPSYATAHENLGDIYARLASQAYDKALQLDSSNTSAQTKLALIRDLMSVSSYPASRGGKTPIATAAAEAKAADAKPVEAKPVEAKPVEAAKPVAPAKAAVTADVAAQVAKTIEAWAAAWSKKDVKAYLAYYAKDFQTPGGQGRAAWEAERQHRIARPGAIKVSVENIRVTPEGPDKAVATFRQHYRSATLKTASNKVLQLERHEGRWLIRQERVGN